MINLTIGPIAFLVLNNERMLSFHEIHLKLPAV